MSSHKQAAGPFSPVLNAALSTAFGEDVGGLSASFGEGSANASIGAAAHATESGMSFGSGIREDLSDPFSMNVIAHEVAHMLGGVGSGETLLDEPGDPGEQRANRAGQDFATWVTGGMQGQTPTLDAATGGRASVHRFALGGIGTLMDDVHEDITRDAIALAGGEANTGEWTDQNTELLRGVYFNDDPDGLMFSNNREQNSGEHNADFSTGGSLDWYRQFDLQSRGDQPGLHDPLTGRSHHGDLQFLHGMASNPGEDPETTMRNMQMWSNFTTGVATGNISGSARLSEMDPALAAMFPDQGDMTVEELFGIRDGNGNVQDRAMGSLMHMVQDSYAGGHVQRNAETGEIENFHAYNAQDHGAHGHSDEIQEDGSMPPGTQQSIAQSARLLEIHRDTTLSPEERQARLREVMNNEVLVLSEDATPASAGEGYEHEEEAWYEELWHGAKGLAHDAIVYGSPGLDLIAGGADIVDNAWDHSTNGIGDAWDTVTDWAPGAWQGATDTVAEGWNDATDAVGNRWDSTTDSAREGWGEFTEWGSGQWTGATESLSNSWNSTTDEISSGWSSATEDLSRGWNSATDTVGETVSSGWNSATEGISSGWNSATEDLGNGWDSATDTVGDTVSSGWSSATDSITSLFTW